MRELPLLRLPDELMLEAEADPDQRSLEELHERGETLVPGWLGGTNRVSLGRPDTFDLRGLYPPDQLDPLIAHQLGRYDFWLVRLALGFRPAPECSYSTFSLRVRLEPKAPHSFGDAVVYQLEPSEIRHQRKVTRRLMLSPSLKLSLPLLGAVEGQPFELERSAEELVYEPAISTFGVQYPEAGWEFTQTGSTPLHGTRELFLVIRLPQGGALDVSFMLAATIIAKVGRLELGSFRLRDGGRPLVTERYPLNPQ